MTTETLSVTHRHPSSRAIHGTTWRMGGTRLWKNDVNGDGVDDPGDDFPNDGADENEVIINAHIPLAP